MKPLKQKRVLIALHRYEAGGAESQALFLAKGLVEQGFEVIVVAFGKEGGLTWERFKESGIHAMATGFSEKLLLDTSGIKGRYLRWKYTRKLVKQVLTWGVDVIFPFTYTPNVIFGLYWQKMGVQTCYWNQRDEGISFGSSKLEIKALENCTGVISNSESGKLFLKQYTSRPITIIHNGVLVPVVENNSKGTGPLRVVMLANLHANKDHLTLLKAWKLVLAQIVNFSEPELILAGKEGEIAQSLKIFVNEHQLHTVSFAGQVSDISELLATCQIGAFSSLKEGLPNGILECMAATLPVVATKMKGAEETLGRDCGFLCNPEDEHEMAIKLLQLITNPKLRELEGKKNKERIIAFFNMQKMIDAYIKLIEHG